MSRAVHYFMTLCRSSAKNNQPYHFTSINTQWNIIKLKTQVSDMTDIHNPSWVQFHNLWGRHMAGISLFVKWSPLLHVLLDFQFHISHTLGVSLTHISIHHYFPLSPLTFLILSLGFVFFSSLFPPLCQHPLHPLSAAVWLVIMSRSNCVCAGMCLAVAPVGFRIPVIARRNTWTQ